MSRKIKFNDNKIIDYDFVLVDCIRETEFTYYFLKLFDNKKLRNEIQTVLNNCNSLDLFTIFLKKNNLQLDYIDCIDENHLIYDIIKFEKYFWNKKRK